jgi:hypothetical protein
MKEEFLDNIFGANSKLTREEYEAKVITEKWMFSAKGVRTRVEKALKDAEKSI